MAFFEINSVKCGYHNSFMMKDISFSIKKGEFLGIIGHNGSGKTTLFKAITGEISLQDGNIILKGVNVSTLSPKEKAKKIAIVSQNTEATDITVEDYVLLGRIPYKNNFQWFSNKNDISLASRFMKLTGVYNYRHKMMNNLSGGQQQLAAVARVLTQQPDVLLLDEPTSHLDIAHQVQILNLIQKLNDEMNLTVLMVIHDLNLAGEYCNKLVMLKEGSIFTQGEPEQVLNYKNIENVYNTVVITQKNPYSGKPSIFLVSQKTLNSIGEKG